MEGPSLKARRGREGARDGGQCQLRHGVSFAVFISKVNKKLVMGVIKPGIQTLLGFEFQTSEPPRAAIRPGRRLSCQVLSKRLFQVLRKKT